MEYGIRNPTKSAYLQRWLDMQSGAVQIGYRLTTGITSCLFAHDRNYELCGCVKERSELQKMGIRDINFTPARHQ